MKIANSIPALQWLRGYDRRVLLGDAVAAVIVTIILIPQSLRVITAQDCARPRKALSTL